jgi:EAL domain-containing protein (putative c-di-GMP-specific phosphodiesterase class I)
LIPPDRFIPLAEQTGLIRSISRWALNEGIRQCRVWHEAGIEISVAVNLSMRDLQEVQLPRTIAGLCESWGVLPTSLEVEITETAIAIDMDSTLKTLSELRAMGVSIAIDDFGTGYSSLALLRRLPLNTLKIDKSFVQGLTTDENDAAIVRATIELGHNLGLKIVAEGVEDQATWNALAALGCDIAQGYLLSRPIPPADLTQWMHESPWGKKTLATVMAPFERSHRRAS